MALRSGFGKMACKEHEQDLVLYYYSELGDEDRKRVQGHLESCGLCRGFLADLESLLPITIKPDDPPSIFWDNYTQGVRAKLALVKEKRPWWRQLPSYLTPWPLPALATALAVIIAVTLTLTSRPWRTQELPPKEEALLEVLPIAENLEFFRAMEFLDAMDLLESMGGPSNGSA